MKSKIILLCLSLTMSFSSRAQYVTIPDANFVSFLQTNFPACMVGNQMDTTCATILNDSALDLSARVLSDLTGIQYFINLKYLDCQDNAITNLSILPNLLEYIDCSYNQLGGLPILPDSLRILRCSGNLLTSLPSFPDSLKTLYCYGNLITSLPALPNSIIDLSCGYNVLTVLPALPNSLIYLECAYNQFANLPVLPNSLYTLSCNNNFLTSLPSLPNSLVSIRCENNQLNSLPVLPNTLVSLYCQNNLLSSLPIVPNSLQFLYCQNNLLTSLPAVPNSLENLYCQDNLLTSLPTLPNSLEYLYCNNNLLTSLPFLPNSLYGFHCENNNICCFPQIPFVADSSEFSISGNPFSCLPNYTATMDSTTLTFPLCIDVDLVNNPNGCPGAQGISGHVYSDNNFNCLMDAGDQGIINIPIKIYDSSNNLLAQTYTFANGLYDYPDSAGLYTVKLDTTGILSQCLYPGIDSSITLSAANPLANINFDIVCKPGFDIGSQSVRAQGIVFPGVQHKLYIVAGDMSHWCNFNCADGISGLVQITVTGPVTYDTIGFGALTPSVAGNVFTYSIANFGTVNNSSAFNLLFTTDTSATIGDQICVNILITPLVGDNDTSNNTFQFCYLVGNSFDPNFKEVYPVNVLAGYQDYLTYTVHFQNTGTAPAMNIRLADTLDNNLDLSTFQVINYSHYNTVSLLGNVITFHFPNIMLPDSTTDFDGSQGFVQYRVKPKAGLPAGTQITNNAYIYFDYNSPIITNTTINTFTSSASINEVNYETKISIFPNPSNGIYTIKLSESKSNSVFDVEIFNLIGESILKLKNQKNMTQIDLSNKPNGVYFVKINNDSQSQTKRIIKQ